MSRRFSMNRGSARVVFGAGSTAELAREVAAIGVERALVVCTPGRKSQGAEIVARLGTRGAGVLATAREHVPAEIVTAARAEASRVGADALLAVGGGSSIGLAKALGVEMSLRVFAAPTTYSGSEMTPIYGVTHGSDKRVSRDERARPSLVIYDSEMTTSLSRDATLASLWNAMAHAVEALWAKSPDRATTLAAEDAIRLIANALTRLSANIDDRDARDVALEGAFLGGAVFADVGGGLHHKLCHVLGGALGLAHAGTHAVLLPHVARFHRDAAPDAMAAIARALHAIDPVRALFHLAETTAPRGLASLGMRNEDIPRVVDAMLTFPPFFPREIDRTSLEALLSNALESPAKIPSPEMRAPATIPHQSGFGGTHESEALPGALPRSQNTPRPSPYGLYPESLNGTPFTVKSTDNSRVWMYRVRPSFSHDEILPLPASNFLCELGDVEPNRTRWRPLPIPDKTTRTDFLDGLVTLGGAGDTATGPSYSVHLYAANADMEDRAFGSADGDLLIVPQTGTLDIRTELGWLRVPQGSIALIPRAIKFAVALPDGHARGWMLEVMGPRFRLPERGPIGSNGLADARHFLAPCASYEDRLAPNGFQIVSKLGGRAFTTTQSHSPFDVVAWHGNHVPYVYDLSLFNAMGSVTWDHPDPSILTVLTAPLDDKGRALTDFVAFPGRWMVSEHSFRPPYMHRNSATELNGVIRVASAGGGYDPGVTFISPVLTSHGISTASYDHELEQPDATHEVPARLPDESLWMMFESALPFRTSRWARETPLVDRAFLDQFKGMKKRFDPNKR